MEVLGWNSQRIWAGIPRETGPWVSGSVLDPPGTAGSAPEHGRSGSDPQDPFPPQLWISTSILAWLETPPCFLGSPTQGTQVRHNGATPIPAPPASPATSHPSLGHSAVCHPSELPWHLQNTRRVTGGDTPVPRAFWASQWYRPWSSRRTACRASTCSVPTAIPSLYQWYPETGGWLLPTWQLRVTVSPTPMFPEEGLSDTWVSLGGSVGQRDAVGTRCCHHPGTGKRGDGWHVRDRWGHGAGEGGRSRRKALQGWQ